MSIFTPPLYTAPPDVPRVGELWRILGEIYLVVGLLPPLPEESIFSYRVSVLDPDGRVLECPLYFFDTLVCDTTVDYEVVPPQCIDDP